MLAILFIPLPTRVNAGLSSRTEEFKVMEAVSDIVNTSKTAFGTYLSLEHCSERGCEL
jgi:hypothetical protein